MKYKRREAQPGKVQHERRATALLENYEQSDEEINDADQVDVEIECGQIVNRTEVVEVGVIVTSLCRIRRPFNQVVNFAAAARLIQIQLNLFSAGDFFALYTAIDVLTFIAGHADRQQMIAGNHARTRGCGAGIDLFRND